MQDRKPSALAELCAEFLGTFIILIFGMGVDLQVVVSGSGDHDSIAWAWGLGVALAIYVAGRISGAHLNPAVTLALAAFRGFSWAKVIPFWIAQLLGAFVAALLMRAVYADAIHAFDPHLTYKTQGLFATLPNTAQGVGIGGALLDQIVGTAILLLLIAAVTDVLNSSPGSNMAPLIIGFIVVAIGMAIGSNAGYAINPARDLGPRIAEFITGYKDAWWAPNSSGGRGTLYFWVPILGPLVGGLAGMAVYDLFVGRFIKQFFGQVGTPAEVGEMPTAKV
jgi:glycerol uptake facilitator protein